MCKRTIMKPVIKLLIFHIILFVSQFARAQDNKKLDSLSDSYKTQQNSVSKLKTLNELFLMTREFDIKKALDYLLQQQSLAKHLDDQEALADVDYNFGLYFEGKGVKDSASKCFLKAKRFWEKSGNAQKLVRANNSFAKTEYNFGRSVNALEILNSNLRLIDSINGNLTDKGDSYKIIGSVYQSSGNFEMALKNYINAEKIYSQAGDPLKHATALDDIGYLEGLLGNLKKTIEYVDKAVSIYTDLGNKPLLAKAYQTLGAANAMLDNRDVAKTYFTKSLKIAEEGNLLGPQADALENLGGLNVDAGAFEEGIALQKKGLELRKAVGNEYRIAHSYMNLGSAYRDMKNYNEALRYYNEAAAVAQKADNAAIMGKIFGYRAACYESLGQTAMALTEFKKFKTFNDSIQNETKIREIEKLRAQFDTEKKEQQIAQQDTAISLLKVKEKVSHLQKWLLGIGLVLSLLAFSLGFYGFRQRMKRIQVEKEKVDAELAFKRKELTTHALHLARKNELLDSLKEKAMELKEKDASTDGKGYQQLITSINFDLQDDNNWENFSRYFEEVHKDFNSNASKKYPSITPNELRLMALIKMNLSPKEIANVLNISIPGIKKARQRLRKKMNLSTDESLENAVLMI